MVLTVSISDTAFDDDFVLGDVLLDGVKLTKTTDYALSGKKITFAKTKLAAYTEGEYIITVKTTKLGDGTFSLAVEDTTGE